MPIPSTSLLPGASTLPATVAEPAASGLPAWAPTLEQVAALVASYAREHVGGYLRPGDDREQAGRERPTFTEQTDPTASQVRAYIATACQEIVGRIGIGELPARTWELARTTATWHAAASVDAKRRPTETDSDAALYRAFISNYTASLNELITQARWAPLRLV